MSANTQANTEKEDRPLTSADVARLLHEVGDPQKLNLKGKNLQGIDLANFKLAGANLSEANLINAHLSRCDLTQANFSNAIMGRTVLVKVDLRTVKGLETVQHQDSSGIDTATIYQSEGDIPEAFLRGAGVPF